MNSSRQSMGSCPSPTAPETAPESTAALTCQALCASLGGRQVLHDITLHFPAGQWISVVGPNGAGKSTLLKALAQLLPYQGMVTLAGADMRSVGARHRARQLAWLGQQPSYEAELSVYDLAMLGRVPHQPWLAAPSAADHAAVQQALQQTQMWDMRLRPMAQLSGGERQRAFIARALAVQAEVLLLDEPLVNLDPPHQADCMDIARQLARSGRTVVSALHEISAALQADAMLVLQAGRVLHYGRCDDSATHKALEHVFAQRVKLRAIDGQWLALPQLVA